MGAAVETHPAIAGIHATSPEPLPFAPSLTIRAFLLEREPGNLLVYNTGVLDADAAMLEAHGGIARQYLNHRHEAMFTSASIHAPLFCHALERDSVAKTRDVRATFSRRHEIDGDFEVIPTPGHTPGATAYLWDSGAHRVLFTSDTVSLDRGEWVAAVLGSSDRDAYVASLEHIATLDFDVLVPWTATAGGPWYATTSRDDARRRVRAIADRVRRGAGR